ncbi:MAG: hypothetical protein ACE5G2_10370 [Candidatus Krumholzibacteriia bacterium]
MNGTEADVEPRVRPAEAPILALVVRLHAPIGLVLAHRGGTIRLVSRLPVLRRGTAVLLGRALREAAAAMVTSTC